MIIEVPIPGEQSPPPQPLPEDRYRLQTSRISGYTHHGHDAWLHQMKLDDELQLIAEPANPHDKYAIRVHWQNKHIGYLPRTSNHVVSRLLRQGAPVTAVIAWLDSQNSGNCPLTLHVFVTKF